ncbi:MAG TPA: hypothetical protein VK823_09640 [Streptosporangiaceae bacterium]|jgi:hypothetical protein|nr:hypothetical protein [Streptosporangiaceae bacterium]
MLVSKALAAKVGVLVAAGGIALSGVAAASASTAAPAVHRIPTALSISNSKRVEHAHQTTAVINGHLTAGTYNLRHLPVVLQRLGIKGHWNRVQLKWTRIHGHVFFLVHVFKKPATFRLVFRGTGNFAPSTSKIDTIVPVK